MQPTKMIGQDALRIYTAVDTRGRKLVVRRLTALDTLRLFKAAGPTLSLNESWLSMASLAISVLEIDGVPVPTPTTEAQIEGLIERLGDEGLAAAAAAPGEENPPSDQRTQVGN